MPISLVGRVVKSGFMNKTVTVSVDRWATHPRTHKTIKRTTKVLTHDPRNVLRTEDVVRIRSCTRKSKRKQHELEVILQRGWDGQQFDKANPGRAPPIAVTQRALQLMRAENAKLKEQLGKEEVSEPMQESEIQGLATPVNISGHTEVLSNHAAPASSPSQA
ncbi:SubName: Full=Uncharacterized protein {ECO:0000313/EMBL:CCA67526.1} [Serendipita indica DSM 11827]|uniref:30S ribosomal protein S17 n=1 Tax=Serendipita indica (strain DSM 11827) TaxID=1109443 RepID=G4T8A0_SERID|nr:SubName: Full=Uncharacterized protein {ECO:0000313/EMBL:CCA67526.1} [Serendipita indica DSM 11827]CCA67526.1 hypothetical protein PIIN_01355 [Serendipita indica DSM 11827]